MIVECCSPAVCLVHLLVFREFRCFRIISTRAHLSGQASYLAPTMTLIQLIIIISFAGCEFIFGLMLELNLFQLSDCLIGFSSHIILIGSLVSAKVGRAPKHPC